LVSVTYLNYRTTLPGFSIFTHASFESKITNQIAAIQKGKKTSEQYELMMYRTKQLYAAIV
jgi:hypothetical protein